MGSCNSSEELLAIISEDPGKAEFIVKTKIAY